MRKHISYIVTRKLQGCVTLLCSMGVGFKSKLQSYNSYYIYIKYLYYIYIIYVYRNTDTHLEKRVTL